ncbi:hypothetical protein QUF95_15370 [Paenibacillus silvae]|nr:hypothetical protein [Paenibacillus silvae]MDM5278777.1 hypothetical protein [Paenibacillus silvae]
MNEKKAKMLSLKIEQQAADNVDSRKVFIGSQKMPEALKKLKK